MNMEHGVLIKDFETGQTIRMTLEEWEKCKITANVEPEPVRSTGRDLYALRQMIVEAIKAQRMDLSIVEGEPCNDFLNRCLYSVHNLDHPHPCCITDRRKGIVDVYLEYCNERYLPAWAGEKRAAKFLEFVNMYFADKEDKI